ncbi:hypothetical protein C5167_029425 [Papaver somniferum]|uniref:glucan endo-1,3-beta-glucosidase-like n=1 Tax=Papaver somniferum TaxID=3469 RepID=UPI000E6F4826|nr:glucan endo-1,3-beta-glucosidase-like [Papaver somniferum]RZC93784.1 hypothetical protein C5167_029425 [Papaver somniferum]
MAIRANKPFLIPSLSIILLLSIIQLATSQYTIGVNYGMVADNLPPPSAVASFLQSKTNIDRIKLFDANPDVLRAFANTNISVTVSIANGYIPDLTDLQKAKEWVSANVVPFYPQTKIIRVLVGNEVMYWKDKKQIAYLLRAMESVHTALQDLGLNKIQVSTPHALNILSISDPPSAGQFKPVYDTHIIKPILEFHNRTKSPFMVCPYPYFGFNDVTLNYAIFKSNPGAVDKNTGKRYMNMFEQLLDATHSAMKRVGFGDVEIVVAETGWPSIGGENQPAVSVENALSYNGGVVKFVNSGKGTPLMPNKKFETYIFSLFNENQKPMGVAEQNFGLFKADFTPVYDVGILKTGDQSAPPSTTPVTPTPTPVVTPAPVDSPTPVAPVTPAPVDSPTPTTPAPADSKQWCVPAGDVSDEFLQHNIDYVCSLGSVGCQPIQDAGACFDPNTIRSHASFAMNAYYQTFGHEPINCDFTGTGIVVNTDPSYGTCEYEC